MNFRWSTAFKIAWREARSSSFKFLFVILAVAVGVGSLTGVLRSALTSNTVAVSDDVLLRLRLKIGDTIQLGGQPFRIIGQVTYEPDRMLGSLNVGPRVMMTRAGLDRTGLMMPGSRAAERFLFRLQPNSPSIAVVRDPKP